MTYNEVINRMGALGDALQLPLPAKAMSATLLMRTHYAKGIKEWQTICEQLHKDIPQKDDESEDDYMARINEVATDKSKEKTTLADRRYTPEVFEQICGAATDKGEMQSSVHVGLDDKGKPTAAKVPAWMWLEYIAANLVQEE